MKQLVSAKEAFDDMMQEIQKYPELHTVSVIWKAPSVTGELYSRRTVYAPEISEIDFIAGCWNNYYLQTTFSGTIYIDGMSVSSFGN